VSVRRWGIGEPVEQVVEGGLAVVDRGAFVVGEGNGGEHALELVLGFQQLALGRLLRQLEVAAGAGHAATAALQLGRRHIGVDLSSEHAGIARRRLSLHFNRPDNGEAADG
jgi:hypothetical protein